MKKSKIAISIDNSVLNIVDSYIDNEKIRSRSQAIEFLLRSVIKSQPVVDAVILLKPGDERLFFNDVHGKMLIEHHLSILGQNGIENVYFVVGESDKLEEFVSSFKGLNLSIIEQKSASGNGDALKLVRDNVGSNFVLVNGDTLNWFDFRSMIGKHLELASVMTMGLISSSEPKKFGAVMLDGDDIVEFEEKGESSSNIINAGVYVCSRKVFEFFNVKSLERDLFPVLAKERLLKGYFTYGKYLHLG